MKLYIYFVLSFTSIAATFAQQRDFQLTRRQKILQIQEGTTRTFTEAEQLLKQQEDGWKCCAGGSLSALAAAGFWAALENKELLCSYGAVCTDPQIATVTCCCRLCALTSWTMCAVGTCAICDCG